MARHRVDTEVRQHQIVEAARKILTARGAEALTIEALAEAVGVTEGAIYRHFASKQEILLALAEEIEETLLEEVGWAQRKETSALGRLEETLKAHLSYSERRRGVGFLVIAEALRMEDQVFQERVARLVERYLTRIKAILREGMATGEVRRDVELDAAASLFFGVVQATVTLWALQGFTSPLPAEQARSIWQVYKKGIVPR